MLEFLNLKEEAFGLAISASSLKIAKLKGKEKPFDLVSFGEAEIAPGIIKDGEIQKEDDFTKGIKEALAKTKGNKLKTRCVVASLPEEKAFLEVIQMPKLKPGELEDAVYLGAENYIPLPLDDVYLDFQIVDPLLDHLDHTDVLIAALPRKVIDPYVESIKKAGLYLKALEIESLSIARALVKNETSPSPILIVDFGANKTSFIIFSGHSVRFTRSVSISSQAITNDIAKELNLPLKEAEALKIKVGLEKEFSPGKLLKTISPVLDILVTEIEKCLDYYQEHIFHEHLPSGDRGIKKILLSGGGANLKGFPEFLTMATKQPVEIGNPWINILETPIKKIPPLSYEKSLSFTTALGLALRGLKEAQ